MLMEKRDMGYARNATLIFVSRAHRSTQRCDADRDHTELRSVTRSRISSASFHAALRPGHMTLVRHRHPAIVDQIVQRLLHVDIRLDYAGLLQGDAGLQDRVALLGTDLVVGDGGAFLELLVGDRV